MPECPGCETNAYVGPAAAGAGYVCNLCSRLFSSAPSEKKGRAGYAQSTRARSSRQERYNARAVGGRLTANSGAGADKGDVKVPGVLREEDKTTLKGSYVLKLADLRKVQAAARGDEIPVLSIAFGDNLKDQFVVVQRGDFNRMFQQHREK